MSSFPQRSSLFLAALVVAVIASMSPPLAAQDGRSAPPSSELLPSGPMARDQAAIGRLGRSLSTVAEGYRLDAEALEERFLTDPSLAVDRDGELVYLDPLAPGEDVVVVLFDAETVVEDEAVVDAETVSAEDDRESSEDGSVFELASLPGADKTIYLDFDGHVTEETSWNSAYGMNVIESLPYDLDGDPDTWSAEELDAIASTWASVAEDLDPWNVNVTTIEPPVDDLRRTGEADTRWGARLVFGIDFADCGCGGQAYVGAFDDATDEPAFIHNKTIGMLAETATHQVGHLLGLTHDGSTIGSTTHRSLGPRPAKPGAGDPNDGDLGAGDSNEGDSGDGADPGEGSEPGGDTEPPATPVGVIGVDLGGTVLLGWAPNGEEDLAGYVVEWSIDPDGPFTAIVTTSLNGHVDPAAEIGGNHYRVRALDTSNNLSEPIEVEVVVAATSVGSVGDA